MRRRPSSARRSFIVRCEAETYDRIKAEAARLGYASPTAKAKRPGIARFMVDRALSGAVLMTDEDRADLGRLHWAIREATVELAHLVDVAFAGDTVEPAEAHAALAALRDAAQAVCAARR